MAFVLRLAGACALCLAVAFVLVAPGLTLLLAIVGLVLSWKGDR